MTNDGRITYFGETDSRGKKVKFGIKTEDRTKHTYVIGKTGMGKSTLLENMAIQDIHNGEGLAFIDPHGSTAEKLLEYIPEERIQDVLYFAPFDLEHPVSFNVMEKVDPDKRHLVANGLMSVFEKIWEDAWSARMAYILNNTILALLEYPGATLLGINRMLADKDYRKKVVENIQDPSVKSFWVDEFGKYTERFAAEATPAIQNKVGQFTSNALMRNIIGQPESSFDIRDMMDTRKILIINLSKGRVGEGNANLLGSMLITKIYLAAMSRADVSETTKASLPNFYLYVDEFQSFANRSFADILSEARKYKLNLTIAHQYVEQMSEEVRAAVFGNVGTMITFRVGAIDAEAFEKEYSPTFMAEDIVNLGVYQMYLKLMIDGVTSHPFSATSLPPIQPTHASVKEKVITYSQEYYGKPRTLVEEKIQQWHKPIAKPATTPKASSKSQDTEQKSTSKPDTQPRNKSYLPPLTEDQLKQMQELSKKPKLLTTPKVPKPTQLIQNQQSQQKQKLVQDTRHQTSKNYSIPKMPTSNQKHEAVKRMSLRDLTPQVPQKNVPKKELGLENRLELQKALASVMNGGIPKEKGLSKPEEKKRPSDSVKKITHASPNNFKDTKIEKKEKEVVTEISTEQQSFKNNSSRIQNNIPSSKKSEISNTTDNSDSSNIKEVPEETLRKILTIEDIEGKGNSTI